MARRRWFILAGFVTAACPAVIAARAPQALKLERIVLVMRHGVRPPTKAQPIPANLTAETWPSWSVNPGWLTAHGSAAIRLVAQSDRTWLAKTGIVPATGCPAAESVAVIADSDQRTIATGENWAEAFAPGCAVKITHRPQGESDPLFSPLGAGATIDPTAADAAVRAAIGTGGMAALQERYQPLLRRLDTILCGDKTSSCGVARIPSDVSAAKPNAKPKLSGALDLASTAAQSLLLEYADGKPMSEVGWGRARTADVTALSQFHALEFRLAARPLPVARANLSLLAPVILGALEQTSAKRVTVISGHDTQVANLGGALDIHWHIPGFAQDDPAPGGAMIFERLRDRSGHSYVRVSYRAQTLDGIRSLKGEPTHLVLSVPGCARHTLCTIEEFRALL